MLNMKAAKDQIDNTEFKKADDISQLKNNVQASLPNQII